jgi:RHS repeat-associated protein
VETIFHDGTKTISGYDSSGRLTSRTDQLNRTTQYEYDAAGRLTAVVDALGQRTEYGYDEAGNLVTQLDANGHITRYEYDGLGRRVATELPLGQRSATEYNQVGSVISTTDFNGDTLEFVYDERNQLLSKEHPDGTSVGFTYTLSGQRETYTDARGTTTWAYDERTRLVSRTDPDGQAISYTYDATGNRTSLTTMAGTVSYAFDALNRLETVTDPEAGITQYQYNAVSNLVRTDFPNGTSETRQYDDLNRLLFLENRGPDGVVSSYAYTLAATGRRDSVVEADGRQVEYDYDALDRLTQERITDAVFGDRTIDYVYDPVGNRLSRNDSAEGQTDYSYDANDRLLTETLAAEISQYTYDDNGNTLSKISAADRIYYEWDFENRLIAADTDGDGTADVTNQYDADGIRVAQTVGSEETRFLIDTVQPYQQVVAEYTPGGVLKVSYVRGLDLISQNRLATDGITQATSFYHVDGLGSTRALSDATGHVTDRYIYDAFGRTIGQVGSTGNVYLFAGEQRDTVTGLDYLRARHMDTGLGRFVSRDSFAGFSRNPITLHKYHYGNANPANIIDPSGQFGLIGASVGLSIQNTLATVSTPSYSLNLQGGSNFQLSLRAKMFRIGTVEPALRNLSFSTGKTWDSKNSVHLLVGTALQESLLEYRRQIGGGPARGLFQMEKDTFDDIFTNYLAFRTSLRTAVEAFAYSESNSFGEIEYNDRFAAIMARIHYARVASQVPSYTDAAAMAAYWKNYYNSSKGKGTESEFKTKYEAAGLNR